MIHFSQKKEAAPSLKVLETTGRQNKGKGGYGLRG
jgi:hypothetical protein